jgi:hypothetical protein
MGMYRANDEIFISLSYEQGKIFIIYLYMYLVRSSLKAYLPSPNWYIKMDISD